MQLFAKITLWGLLLLMLQQADAQPRINAAGDVNEVHITFNKTSSIIFPAVIKSVDRGSRDILAQKAIGVENILQLKAARINFPETNLTVITADGKIHQFTIHYEKQPCQLIFSPDNQVSEQDKYSSLIFSEQMTETEMEACSDQIVNSKRKIRAVGQKKFKVSLALHGVYIRDNVIFLHLQVGNQSNINYDIEFLRFYIHDKEKVKRTASQEVYVKPFYTYGNDRVVRGNAKEDIVFAVEKFTIPDAKRLVIEMFEKNGGRNLNLSIKNKTIVNAQLIE